MHKGTLALLIHGGTENWSPVRWKRRFDEACHDRRVWLLPDAGCDPSEIRYAAVWKPYPGELAGFPNLRVIFNLGAGVDALIADATLPKVPLVRVSVGDLTDRMTEYVVLHVLMHHRQELYLRASQREKIWAPKYQWPAAAISVGIMGLGTLGSNAARALRHLGFRVSGWSRNPKQLDGVSCFHGNEQLDNFLERTDILVCLLNAGRGGLQNEPDILQCLDDGTLGAASLDVFAQEPLPAESAFWTHPKVVLTPHNAADTDPDEISKYVARQIERFEAGGALENVVDPARGY
jgi:glyoxylate/hydroxypyruvate reductase A